VTTTTESSSPLSSRCGRVFDWHAGDEPEMDLSFSCRPAAPSTPENVTEGVIVPALVAPARRFEVAAVAYGCSRVFDLARSIDLHTNSTSKTGERAVAGVTSGLIGAGDEVTWRARHFGLWQYLTVRVEGFDPPTYFSDRMLRGAFQRMEHHHHFAAASRGTTMRDVFEFQSPLGLVGRVVDVLLLKRYLRSFLVERNRMIKATAESDGWRKYLQTA
jgi:ligand-binding SRPBCC domain-containing protein